MTKLFKREMQWSVWEKDKDVWWQIAGSTYLLLGYRKGSLILKSWFTPQYNTISLSFYSSRNDRSFYTYLDKIDGTRRLFCLKYCGLQVVGSSSGGGGDGGVMIIITRESITLPVPSSTCCSGKYWAHFHRTGVSTPATSQATNTTSHHL